MDNNMVMRRLNPEDMDKWFSLRIEALNNSPSAFLASPGRELEQGVEFFRSRMVEGGDNNVIFGSFKGDRLTGIVGLVRERHEKASHKAHIWGMYVDIKFRRSGIGRKLMEEAISFANLKMKVEQITLSVESTRTSAKKLYISLGFKTWGIEPNAICIENKYFDEEYMMLKF